MPGKHRLYMHCPGLSEDQLYVYLQQFGRVTDVYLPKNLDGTSKGYGFASFESAEGLTAALAAGDEHNIGGKAVKVNRAGPRPAPQLVGTPEPSRLHPTASTGPLPGGITRQQGGHALPERIPPQSTSVPPGQAPDQVGSSDGGGSSRLGLLQGAGPRIYVGGIPNAVSETMVRNYFSNWGKVEDVYFPKERSSGRRRPFCFVTFASQKAAEKAVAQSNREISGYQVASISMTADRIAHYQQVTGGSQDQPMADDKDQTGAPRALTLQTLLPHLSTSLPLAGREGLLHGHQQGLSGLTPDAVPGPSGLGGQLQYTLEDLFKLHPSLFGYLQQGQVGLPTALQQPLLPLSQQPLLGAAPLHATVPTQLQDAFMTSMASADLNNPALFSSSFPALQQPAFGHPSQLQAYPQQPSQGVVGSAGGVVEMMGQATPLFGHPSQMLPYSALPQGVLPLARGIPVKGLSPHPHSILPQANRPGIVAGPVPQTPASIQELMLQAFDPTVRRPEQNFFKASSVSEDPLMGPYLSLQIPVSQDYNIYGPMRPITNFLATRRAPY